MHFVHTKSCILQGADLKASDDDLVHNPVELTAIYNIVSQHAADMHPLFTVNYVTVGGRLCISIQYYTDRTSKLTAQHFTKTLTQYLIEYS